MLETLFAVVPAWIDDPDNPSGGNVYDRRVLAGLGAWGWTVRRERVPGGWPDPSPADRVVLADIVAAIPDGAVVLVDGIVGSAAPEVLLPHARRLREVVLVHLPLAETPAPPAVVEGERAVLRAATAVVTTSCWTRQRVLECYHLPAGQVHVARPGTDPVPASPPGARTQSGPDSAGALLCVAPIARHKGHDVLVDALAALTDLPWSCRCVGSTTRDPAFAAATRRRAEVAGIGGRLTFAGPLGDAELDRAYAAAGVLVHPSRGETYGMVLAEAIAHGLPVIASEVGGVREAVDDPGGETAGLLVTAGDPADLALSIRRWLTDADLRDDLVGRAWQRRETLTGWDDTAERIHHILTEVAA